MRWFSPIDQAKPSTFNSLFRMSAASGAMADDFGRRI
jgi:hypothetical protein